MQSLLTFSCLVTSVLAVSRTSAPSGCVTVGSEGDYSTVQEAISGVGSGNQCIFIASGTYNERVKIPSRSGVLTIYGSTNDTSSYLGNQVTIQHNSSQLSGAGSNDNTSTVSNRAASSKFYNINIKNTYGKGSQAVALSAQATNQSYYGVGFYGYQDTLLANVGQQVYAKCFIQGAVDFIFGQRSTVWIDGSTISLNGNGFMTASGRSSNDSGYFVINNSTIVAGPEASAGSSYLGRPWGAYARVCVQNTYISRAINSTGWHIWNTGDARTSNVTFQEYGNTGPGANGTRASFSQKISSALSISNILNSTNWIDTSYLS